MSVWPAISTIVLVHLLGCMSPGPDFIIVVKNTLGHHYRLGVYTALGVAMGIFMHCSYCALGLGLVLAKIPLVFYALRVVGAAYLAYLGVKIFFSQQIVPHWQKTRAQPSSAWRAFLSGFLTNALNPKAVLFILGLYILITKLNHPLWSYGFVVEMTVVSFLWFTFIAYCFSLPGFKAKLLKIQSIVSKCLALFLWGFAGQLLWGGN